MVSFTEARRQNRTQKKHRTRQKKSEKKNTEPLGINLLQI